MTGAEDRRAPSARVAVFISYRRRDSAGHVGRLRDSLLARARARLEVFVDTDSLGPGSRFGAEIEQQIRASDVFLAVIGPAWLDIADHDGRRLDDPADYVRREVETALASGCMIVPVLVDGATMPEPEALPVSIRGLAEYEAFAVTDSHWSADVGRLTAAFPRPSRRRLLLAVLAATVALAVVAAVAVVTTDSSTGSAALSTDVRPPRKVLVYSNKLVGSAPGFGLSNASSCEKTVGPAALSVTVRGAMRGCDATIVDSTYDALVDTSTEVDVVASPENDGNEVAIGLICRSTGPSSSPTEYVVEITRHGRIGVDRLLHGSETYVKRVDTGRVLPLEMPHRYRLDCVGTSYTVLKFSVDGHLLLSYADPARMPPGKVGVSVSTTNADQGEAKFGDFDVYSDQDPLG